MAGPCLIGSVFFFLCGVLQNGVSYDRWHRGIAEPVNVETHADVPDSVCML